MATIQAPGTASDFRTGFQTVERVGRTDEPLAVEGRIPEWLTGSLVRTGPARFEVGERTVRHWFDGLGMLDRFAISGGGVTYSNAMVESRAYRAAEEEGRIAYREFATDPCRRLFSRVATMFDPRPTDNANVNVSRFGRRWVALTETPVPVEFDPETLETVGVYDWDDDLGALSNTAHPHHDPERGEALGQAIKYGPRSTCFVYRLPDGETRREVIGSFRTSEPPYLHSFGLTERYAILLEQPFVVRPAKLLLSGRPFIDNFAWKPERGCRFHVFDRAERGLRGTYEAEPFFAFHFVNCFERGGELVVDLCAFEDASIVTDLFLDRLREGRGPRTEARLRRYRIDLDGDSAERELTSDVQFELPRIDYRRRNGRDYRYAYGASYGPAGSEWFDQLAKLDLAGGDVRTWRSDGCHPGEPIFVAAPGAEGEDQGVVVSVVLDTRRDRSFLLVLDARSFEEVARAEAPMRLPFNFHGQFARG